jgi:hypothetical protein
MINSVKSFHDPVAWQKAMKMVTVSYKVSKKFPTAEVFGLTSQIRRAAVIGHEKPKTQDPEPRTQNSKADG